MRTIGAFEAKTNLSKLLERVSRGESVLITKNGKPVAELRPVHRNALTVEQAVERLRANRGLRIKGLTIRELIDEGRRF